MTKFISKTDIRKGDTIKVTFEESGGVSVVYTGTAHTKYSDGDWVTYGNRRLTYRGDDLIDTIELLERPLPTEPGSVFRATEICGEKCDVVVLVVESGFHGYPPVYVSATGVGGTTSHSGQYISAWEPLDD